MFSMRFRKLRIAWSVCWGILAVLLVALWVRSYWWGDTIALPYVNTTHIPATSYEGWVTLQSSRPYNRLSAWQIKHISIDEQNKAEQKFIASGGLVTHRINHFGLDEKHYFFQLPYWFLLLFTAAFIAIPWLPWRFSLRTLLIATTLVAVVLGLIVYAAR
jgi:hypothetical protein